MSESASSSVNPPVSRDLYISLSRIADSISGDRPSDISVLSMIANLSGTTDKFDELSIVSGGV